MTTSSHDRRSHVPFDICLILTILGSLILFATLIAQAYIRFTLNQNFSFLGGAELEVLTGAVFLSSIAMLYCTRVSHSDTNR